MPTYTILTPVGQLRSAQKDAIAKHVTDTHSEVTGAQTFFAQVIFQDVSVGSWYMGGVRLEQKQIYMFGNIRGGRSKEMINRLLLNLRDVLIEISGVRRDEVWVYINELPPSLMLEYGHVLPEPGQEPAWLEGMTSEERHRLESLGK